MKNNQVKYIEYVKSFAGTNRKHVWLGGSFRRGNATPFSDVDISALMEKDSLIAFIYGYAAPIYISSTTNPEGIVIVIYEDGVAVDLEVIGSIDVSDAEFFHVERVKDYEYCRNSSICREICPSSDEAYQTARLFHRSLIKYLAGKRELGVSVANEIAEFMHTEPQVTESDYKNGITCLIEQYHDKYPLEEPYRDLCLELIGCL